MLQKQKVQISHATKIVILKFYQFAWYFTFSFVGFKIVSSYGKVSQLIFLLYM